MIILSKTNTWSFGTSIDPSKIKLESLGFGLYASPTKVFVECDSNLGYIDGVKQPFPNSTRHYDVMSKSALKYMYQAGNIDQATYNKAMSIINYNVNKLSLEDLAR